MKDTESLPCSWRWMWQVALRSVPTPSASRIPAISQRRRGEPPRGVEVHLVMDNYRTHKVTKVRTWLARHPRYHVHFTPTSGNWLNLVERLIAEVTERCVRRGSHTTIRSLERALLLLGSAQQRSEAVCMDGGCRSDFCARSPGFLNASDSGR
jgi:transposase